jgi:hypothetical protein
MSGQQQEVSGQHQTHLLFWENGQSGKTGAGSTFELPCNKYMSLI